MIGRGRGRTRRVEYIQDGPSLADRLWRFVGLVGTVLAIAMVVIVTQRLSNDALAMVVGGALCGAFPAGLVIVGIWYLVTRERRSPPAQPVAQTPPIILQVPQQQFPPQQHGGWLPVRREREFTVVGGDGEY